MEMRKMLVTALFCAMAGTAWGGTAGVNTDGTITDGVTGIEWSADASTPTVNECAGGAKTWAQAQAYVECLNEAEYLGNTDWRLPTVDDFAAINQNLGDASGVSKKGYWTSTEGGDGAYWFKAGKGKVATSSKERALSVWPVRDAAVTVEIPANMSSATAPAVTYTVTINAGVNGKITPPTLPPVKAGSKKTFTVTPDKGFVIASVSVDGVSVPLINPKTQLPVDLTKPFKVALVITKNTTVAATFDDAPKVKGFPTNLTAGTYRMDVGYCVKAGPVNQCSDIYHTNLTFNAEQATYFFDSFNLYFDQYLDAYAGTSCTAKAGCTKFDGTHFGCSVNVTCKYAGYSATAKINYDFTKQ